MAEVELVASKGGAGGTRLLMRRAEKISISEARSR
jgi:DNA-binding IscR family transcriptional regulator